MKRVMLTAILTAVVCISGNVFAVLSGGGTDTNPYLIQSRADFDEFANPANAAIYWASGKHTKLMCNLDLSDTTYTQAVIAPDTSVSPGFQGSKFTGSFDGNSHKINNLTITGGNDYIGLFGLAGSGLIGDDTEIKNIDLVDVDIQGRYRVGGLAGHNYTSTITSCIAKGFVSGTSDYVGGLTGDSSGPILSCHAEGVVSGTYYVGGLVGENRNMIISCSTANSVSGTYYVGGLAGRSNYYGTISCCYATGAAGGISYVGGLAGSNDEGTITSCYTTSAVSGNSFIGGLAGENSAGMITSCYATGSVSGTDFCVGGLVGQNYSDQYYSGRITSCYATGSVNGTDVCIGGLVGYSIYEQIRCELVCNEFDCWEECWPEQTEASWLIEDSFWDTQTSGWTTSAGGTGKNTAEMKALLTFTDADWDFSAIDGDPADWQMPPGDYPKLAWQSILTTVNVPNVVGLVQANAETAITSAGLVVGTVTTVYSSTVAAGDVISQSPTAGTTVDLNTAVDIEVSLGAGSSSPWQLVSNMITARDQFTGCVIGDKIYVFGGNGNPDGFNLNSGEVYDIHSSSWSSITSNTPHGIEELTGVSLNGKFYVFGGWGCDNPSGYCGVANFNEVYDPDTNTWTALAQKPTTTASSVAAVYGGKIYVFGGYYSDEGPGSQYINYTVVEAYDPASDSWDYVTDMPRNLMSPAVAVSGDSAYVIGGYDTDANAMNAEVMVYNFNSDTWTRDYCTASTEATRAYSYAGPAPVMNGKAYLIGGAEGSSVNSWSSDEFTLFDIAAKTWEVGPALPEARCGHLVVVHDETPYVIGGYDDENDLNRAESTVYMLTPMAVDLTGEYWFGSLSADVTTNVPWGKRGSLAVSGNNWSQEWDDNDGHHTFVSTFSTSVQPDGSINVNFPAETYNIAWNGDVMLHANNTADSNNRLGLDIFVRKAAGIQSGDIVGEYGYGGHWLFEDVRGDGAGWGDIDFYSDGTAGWSMTYNDGFNESDSFSWALDPAEPMIQVANWGPALIGEGGIMFTADAVPDDEGDFGLKFCVKRTAQTITMAELAGNWQTRFIESGPGGVPYTCGSGTGVVDAAGTFSLDAWFSDGEHEVFTVDCSVGPGNMFYLGGPGGMEAIVSPDKNLIFLPEYTYDDPANRTADDWIGGIFLIRNVSQSSGTAPSGKIMWQAAKSPYYGDIIYVIHARITIEGMKACSLKGPNMADFEPAIWVPGRGQWSFEKWPFTLSELQQESFGIWQLKLTDNDDQESVYSFDISGTLLDNEFLPVPIIIEPTLFDPNVIAEHYTVRWNPNGAQNSADALGVEIQGNGFHYFSGALDLSTTEWNPGWLEISDANETYCKVGYAKFRPDMIDTPSLVSGPAIDWESTTAALVSGPKRPFTVKYSLDFIDDGRIDLADLAVFCSHWLEAAPSPADFDDGGGVEFSDFGIFAQHWLEDVNDIADHVYEIGFNTEWDYGSPGDSLDDEYGFEITFSTDDTVDYIEVMAPAGNTFTIPNTAPTEYSIPGGWFEGGREFDSESGQYEWYYGPAFVNPDSLLDYGDGLYTFTIHFVGGRVQQTTAWFGIPNTSDPVPQPTQEPVFTSFNHGDTVSSPVTFAWQDCIDPAADYIFLEYDDDNPSVEIEFILPTSATGLDEPLDLTPGLWDDFELSFEVSYESQNLDGIPVYVSKYSESDYLITVQANIADLNGNGDVDYDDLVILANQWLQSPGDPSADIAPPPAGDGIVNLEDFAVFAEHWLEGL